MGVRKQCENCGKGFEVPKCHADRVRCCSRACKGEMKSKEALSSFECRNCHGVFQLPASQARRRKYCSEKCRAEHKGPVEKVCVTCGKTFTVPKCRSETAATCSDECAVPVRAKSRERKRTFECAHCHGVFEAPRSHASLRRFCSRACKEASAETRARKASWVGESNPAWKGGRTQSSEGYIFLSAVGHPCTSQGNYVFEHRLVMEEEMRRQVPNHHFLVVIDGEKYLRPSIEVHHVDGNRAHNSFDNLIACTSDAHKFIHNKSRPSNANPKPDDYWPHVKILLKE